MIHVHFGTQVYIERIFFYQEEAINYSTAILIDLRKMVFILVQEKGGKNPEYAQALNLQSKPGSFISGSELFLL